MEILRWRANIDVKPAHMLVLIMGNVVDGWLYVDHDPSIPSHLPEFRTAKGAGEPAASPIVKQMCPALLLQCSITSPTRTELPVSTALLESLERHQLGSHKAMVSFWRSLWTILESQG
jgi:hypothetical protein